MQFLVLGVKLFHMTFMHGVMQHKFNMTWSSGIVACLANLLMVYFISTAILQIKNKPTYNFSLWIMK